MEKTIVPNLYIIKNTDTEKAYTEYAKNKAYYTAKDENGERILKNAIVYPYIDSIGDLLSIVISIIGKTAIRYGGDNDTINRIWIESKAINGRINHFTEYIGEETRTEYIYRIMQEYGNDTQDIILTVFTSTISEYCADMNSDENIDISDYESVINTVYGKVNEYIYGEKKTYNNESGSYNNLIQRKDGTITRDDSLKYQIDYILNSSIEGYELTEKEHIAFYSALRLLHDSKKSFTSDEFNIIFDRLSGKTYKEISEHYKITIRKAQATIERLQNAMKKVCANHFPELLKGLRKIYKYTAEDENGNTVKDENGETITYNRLMRI